MWAGRPPHRGAWIEIHCEICEALLSASRPPHRGAWIEIGMSVEQYRYTESPPAQGAWIEILVEHIGTGIGLVSPPAQGGVD